MDILVKLNNQTAGRDKLVRFLQYGSRASWYYAQNARGTSTHSIDALKSLEYAFSTFRKLLRLGRCIDSLYSVLSLANCSDKVVRITMSLSKIANALFLLSDHIIWFGRTGLVHVNLKRWTDISNRYWLVTIIANLVRDLYEIVKVLGQDCNLQRCKVSAFPAMTKHQWMRLLSLLKSRQDILLDVCKNGCDVFIPLTSLGYTKLTPGTIGILGLVSSAVGLYTLVDPMARLTPS